MEKFRVPRGTTLKDYRWEDETKGNLETVSLAQSIHLSYYWQEIWQEIVRYCALKSENLPLFYRIKSYT